MKNTVSSREGETASDLRLLDPYEFREADLQATKVKFRSLQA